jgi:hypothetical protein
VKVLDRNTHEVIRQIPNELFLRLAQKLAIDDQVNMINAHAYIGSYLFFLLNIGILIRD